MLNVMYYSFILNIFLFASYYLQKYYNFFKVGKFHEIFSQNLVFFK